MSPWPYALKPDGSHLCSQGPSLRTLAFKQIFPSGLPGNPNNEDSEGAHEKRSADRAMLRFLLKGIRKKK